MKKTISAILCISMLFALSSNAFAASSIAPGETRAAIVTALQNMESDKEAFGLGDVEFSDLYIGDQLHSYEYVETGFEELNSAFPLFYNGKLVALAFNVGAGNFQISSALVAELNNVAVSEIALVYDAHSVYLFDGMNFILLGKSGEEISYRQSFADGFPNMAGTDLKLCNLNESQKVEYAPAPSVREQTYWSCNVKYVPQGDYDFICWAATVACINNCVNRTNLNAVDVAQKYYGPMDFNYTLEPGKCATFMKNTYKLNYTFKDEVPSDLAMLTNIKNGKPMYGSFRTSNGTGHATTIYGINIVSGYITIMDPTFGSTTAYSKNDEYTYYHVYAACTATLTRAICATW